MAVVVVFVFMREYVLTVLLKSFLFESNAGFRNVRNLRRNFWNKTSQSCQ